MKFLLSLLVSICTWLAVDAQTPRVTWGEPIKVKKGSTELDIIHVDKSGIFLQENHIVVRRMAFLGPPSKVSGTLIKLDKNLDEVYRNSFDKELKGKEFECLIFANNKMFLFATAVKKGTKALELFGTELDKTSGEQKGEWKTIMTVKSTEGARDILFSIRPNPDSTAIALATAVEYADRAEFSLSLINDKLTLAGKTLEVNYAVDPKEFVLEEMLYAPDGSVLVVNKMMEYREGKKKKNKFLDFKEYDIRLFDKDGKMISQVNVDGGDSRHIIQSKVVLKKDGNYTLGAFYSKQKKGSIHGLLFVTIDGKTGAVLNKGGQEISNAMLVANAEEGDDDEEEEESRKEAKERRRLEKLQEDDDNISSRYKIKDILSLENGSFMLMAEQYHTYSVTNMNGGGTGMGMGGTTTTTYSVHGNLLFVKVSAENSVEWMQMLPKKQVSEIARNSSPQGYGLNMSIFINRIPATHGSVGTMINPNNGNILIFFNDNPKNSGVTSAGQKAKVMSKVAKSDCFMLEVNQATGNYKRKMLFTNDDIPDAMPSMGSQIGNTYYMTGKRMRIGKTLIAVAKITIK